MLDNKTLTGILILFKSDVGSIWFICSLPRKCGKYFDWKSYLSRTKQMLYVQNFQSGS